MLMAALFGAAISCTSESGPECPSVRNVTVNTTAGPQRIELRFRPNESLMLKIDAEGRVSFVEL